MPWAGTEAPYAFGPTPPGSGSGQPWLPMPADWAGLTVEAQQADEDSTLSFFKRVLRLRREVRAGLPDQVEVLSTAPGTFAFTRGDLVCVVNCGSRLSRLPDVAGELLISSGADPVDGRIAPDTAAWFRTAS